MSDNEQYSPGVRLNVVSPQRWRDRPEMFLGPDRHSWWRVVAERFLGELGAPSRCWSSAMLRADGNHFMWVDDSDTPPMPLGVFWREACEAATVRSDSGNTEAVVVLDSSIPAPATTGEVLHLVRRCTARAAGRVVRVQVEGIEATVASDWREYLSDGGVVGSSRSGVAGDFRFEVATVDSPADVSRAVEVLEQGVPKGTWPELLRLWERSRRPDLRVVLHSETPHSPEERESGAIEALRRALAEP